MISSVLIFIKPDLKILYLLKVRLVFKRELEAAVSQITSSSSSSSSNSDSESSLSLSPSRSLTESPKRDQLQTVTQSQSEKEIPKYKLCPKNLKKMTMEVDLENGSIIEVTIEIFKLNGIE